MTGYKFYKFPLQIIDYSGGNASKRLLQTFFLGNILKATHSQNTLFGYTSHQTAYFQTHFFILHGQYPEALKSVSLNFNEAMLKP